MSVKRMRGGSGLGDSIYMRPIAERLLSDGHQVVVFTFYSDVFSRLPCRIEPFQKLSINVLCHYVLGKNRADTNQWEDICDCAKVGRLNLKFDWSVRNATLVGKVRSLAQGRKVVLIHGGRAPMNRTDGFGAELLPEKRTFDLAQVTLLHEDVFFVRIGEGAPKYAIDHVGLDLWGKTSVSDLIDLAWDCDGIIGPCSFCVPLAECFDKPFLAIWASSGMYHARHPYVKSITPTKILSKPFTSRYVVDSWDDVKVMEKVREFRSLF